MGKQSTRKNKTIYQICREAQGLTREKAAELMDGISDSKIEKIEYELQEPTPYDIVQMADCYRRPDLCNYYCSHKCAIGERYVPEIEVSERYVAEDFMNVYKNFLQMADMIDSSITGIKEGWLS